MRDMNWSGPQFPPLEREPALFDSPVGWQASETTKQAKFSPVMIGKRSKAPDKLQRKQLKAVELSSSA